MENLLQNIILQGWVVTSGFSRVFLQGQTKSRVFLGLPGFPGFVGHPGMVEQNTGELTRTIISLQSKHMFFVLE